MEETKVKNLSMCLNIVNTLNFGLGCIVLIAGIVFLTVLRYDYSFSSFSVTMVAVFFVVLGPLLLFLSVYGIYAIRRTKSVFVFMYISGLVTIFVILAIVGIWGLCLVSSEWSELNEKIRFQMYETIRRYDDKSPQKYETRKMDWMQHRFNCCGVDSIENYKSVLFYGQQMVNYGASYQQLTGDRHHLFDRRDKDNLLHIQYVDNQWMINNRLPYIEDVPDSCCIVPTYQCGKQTLYGGGIGPAPSFGSIGAGIYGSGHGQYGQNYMPTRDRSAYLNVRGCYLIYTYYFTRDLTVLCGIAVAVAAIVLLTALVLVYVTVAVVNAPVMNEEDKTFKVVLSQY